MKRQSVSSCKGRSTRLSTRSLPFSARSVQNIAGAALVATAMALTACSSPDPQAIDYKSDSTKVKANKAPSLSVPPDLLSDPRGATDAPANGEASLAGYQTSGGTPAVANQVLPASQGLHIVRDGDQRWLVVSTAIPPDRLWNEIRAFWQSQGYFLVEDSRQRGVMQTDWMETHTKVDQGIIRNTLTFATKNNYVIGERNRFRTRVEAGPQGQTYVFISQQGLHQVLSGMNNEGSQWETKPNDPGLEADFLARLERSLASGPQESVITQEADAAQQAAKKPVPMPSQAEPSGPAPVVLPAGATPTQDGIVLQEDYNHAWARVGAGLDRAHFTVDSRDIARGLYTIRYVDPNDLGTDAQGFWNQLFHGKKEKVAKQYEINVRALTESQTRIAMVGTDGQPDGSPLAQRIMRLLVSEM